MYINGREDYEHNQFFTKIDELICRCAEQGEGRVDFNIQRKSSRSHSKYYKICASNFPYFSFVSSKTLRVHLSELHNRSTNRQAFEIFKQGLLNVVDESGFGKIHLIFEKGKEETIIFCEITVSRRHTI